MINTNTIDTNPLAGRINANEFTRLYSGHKFFYAEVNDEDIRMIDIAHHLARMGRWLGAMNVDHYSVAEHSWLMADYVYEKIPFDTRRQRFLVSLGALMHDSEEYVTGDFPSPLKSLIPELSIYGNYLRERIFRKFNIPWWTYDVVKPLDYRIRRTEAELVRNADDVLPGIERLDVELRMWEPEDAQNMFLHMYDKLTQGLKRQCGGRS